MSSIYTFVDLKRKNKKQTITCRLIKEFDTTLPTSLGLFSVGEASLFLFKSSKVHRFNAKCIQY
jgi:hypothetical protein